MMALEFAKEALKHIPDTLPKAFKKCPECKSELYKWYQHITYKDSEGKTKEKECFYYCKKCKYQDWDEE